MRRPQSRPRAASNLPKGPAIRTSANAQAKKSSAKQFPKQPKLSKASEPRLSRERISTVSNLASRRHRFRRAAFAIGTLVTVSMLTIMAVAIFSPALAVSRIEVTGTHRISAKSIQNALQGQIGVSLTMVDNGKVAAQLQSFSLIESVDVIAAPPHTLLIKITERAPIAIVNLNGAAVLVDPAGVQIGAVTATDSYPIVDVASDPRRNSNYRAAVDVLLALPSELFPQVASISARSKDDVTLQLRGVANQQIVWGDGSQSALKSKVLAALFKNTKRSVKLTLDVSSPEAPVVRY